MAISMEELFTTLQSGDLLMIPMSLPSDQGKQIISLSAVLRVGDNGELYLSYPNEDRPWTRTYKGHNPFRWDPKKQALVDVDGDVPRWYSIDITRERGGAKEQAGRYAAVPRLEHIKSERTFDGGAFERFIRTDPRCAQLEGIITNGEAGQATWQLALALDLVGVTYTADQLVALAYFMERFESHTKMAAMKSMASVHVVLAGPSDAEAAAGEDPTKH